MYSYVNHQAMSEVFAPVEAELNPQSRANMLEQIQNDFLNHLFDALTKTCWELKHREQWNTGQISETLNISERQVKSFITYYARQTGEWNPLERPRPAEVIDISHLVRRKYRQAVAQPTHDVSEPDQTSHRIASGATHFAEHLHDSVLSADDI